MTKFSTTILFIVSTFIAFSQSVEKSFSQDKMKEDLKVFKEIRQEANSGLYKYRTKEQIDSIYTWAEKEIENSETYVDFFNIISKLTDFEGSLHNKTKFSEKHRENLENETYGYFPYPIKWVEGKWLINFKNEVVPLGSEIISINQIPITEIVENLYKYYPTDGSNKTGKRIGIKGSFSKSFRLHYGLTDSFMVKYREQGSDTAIIKNIKSIGYKSYSRNLSDMHSMFFDRYYYADLKGDQNYKYNQIDASTGLLTIHSFNMGNESTEEHKTYVAFLENVFIKLKDDGISNLIVDVRNNGGGTDPNDLVTYSYLSSRDFQECKQAWISFNKIPLLKYYNSSVPRFLRPLGVVKFNRQFQKRFPIEKDGKYFIGKDENEMKVRKPNKNNFEGNIYLLISPAVASAGSLFAAMVAGNDNTITIGEETMGGYYGHNGHNPLEYKLPKSKIITTFSSDNIEQDVPIKSNQQYDRGVIPDYQVSQTIEDFLNKEDTQMEFVLKLIENK